MPVPNLRANFKGGLKKSQDKFSNRSPIPGAHSGPNARPLPPAPVPGSSQPAPAFGDSPGPQSPRSPKDTASWQDSAHPTAARGGLHPPGSSICPAVRPEAPGPDSPDRVYGFYVLRSFCLPVSRSPGLPVFLSPGPPVSRTSNIPVTSSPPSPFCPVSRPPEGAGVRAASRARLTPGSPPPRRRRYTAAGG
jgi:hypothetical protein